MYFSNTKFSDAAATAVSNDSKEKKKKSLYDVAVYADFVKYDIMSPLHISYHRSKSKIHFKARRGKHIKLSIESVFCRSIKLAFSKKCSNTIVRNRAIKFSMATKLIKIKNSSLYGAYNFDSNVIKVEYTKYPR
jgi:hypothetical protein